MPYQQPVGSVIPNFREHIVANPPQTSNISAGGTQGATTATIGTGQTGLGAGMLVELTGGTAETILLLSYVTGTGVCTFSTAIANTGHTAVAWGYGTPTSSEYGKTAVWGQTPSNAGGTLTPVYQVNQKTREWLIQLRQFGITT